MIEVNLLPSDLKTVRKKSKSAIKIKLPKIAPTPLIIGIISFLLFCQVAFGLLAFTQRRRLLKVSKELTNTSSQGQIAVALKTEVDELSSKFSVIETLTSGSMVWSEKMSDLSKSMIDGVWLTSLYLQLQTPEGMAAANTPSISYGKSAVASPSQVLILKGSAVSSSSGEETAIVGKFIESLRKNKDFFKDFSDIKLSSIESRKLGEVDVMDFTIVCYFKPDRSYFEKLEARNI